MQSAYRFLVSAAHRSSGKTVVSAGLAAALTRRGLAVQTFKKGPDYIDPMWLAAASERPCHNLDFNLSRPDELRREFARHGAQAAVCLVEGNLGLYDGLDPGGSDSNAALARLLDLPVALVIDARGMSRGIAPLLLGYRAFDPQLRFVGVILSRVGGARHEAKLRAAIERYTDLPVLGAVHDDPRLAIAERHLGLVPANEHAAAQARIGELAAAIEAQVDLARLLELTAAPPLPCPHAAAAQSPARRVRLGVARDRAFGFYYAGDFAALEHAGAELCFFDALRDARLPAVDGLFIGGGFPEHFARELEANAALRAQIRAALARGLPAYAECGGLMYLARTLTARGATHSMVGAIEGDVLMHERPLGRGYVRLIASEAHPWLASGAEIRAHEFHHSSIEGLAPGTRRAYRVERGYGIDGNSDGIVAGRLLASYTHLRSAGGFDWTARFVDFVRRAQCTDAPALAAAH